MQESNKHHIEDADQDISEDVQQVDSISATDQQQVQSDLAHNQTPSLEQKLAKLKQFSFLEHCVKGNFIDATDSVGQWCLAEVMDVDEDSHMVHCHFDGWSSKWDIFYKITSRKIGPFRKLVQGYTGQHKVPLRKRQFYYKELINETQKIVDMIQADFESYSPHQLTQYLRGSLYIYTDFLLTANQYDAQQIAYVNGFLKKVLELIVAWFRKVQTLQSSYLELKHNPDLFLVDSHCAIVASYFELMDLLRKIFGGCHRAIRYYLLHDSNVEVDDNQQDGAQSQEISAQDQAPKKSVTKDFSKVNFEVRRRGDDDNYDVDEVKQFVSEQTGIEFGTMVTLVNHFHKIGGFDETINVMKIGLYENRPSQLHEGQQTGEVGNISFDQMSQMTSAFKNLKMTLSEEFGHQFVTQIKEIFMHRIINMSDKDIKEMDKDMMQQVFSMQMPFFKLSMSDMDSAQLIEEAQLQIALRFLKSTYLEKRLKGLQDIKQIIDKVEASQYLRKISNGEKVDFHLGSKYGRLQDKNGNNLNILIHNGIRIKPTIYLNESIMIQWLVKNQVADVLLSENTHVELVKRAPSILTFMSNQKVLDSDIIDKIWMCQKGKHEEMVRQVYALILELINSLSLDQVNIFFKKVIEVPVHQQDEKFIDFIKDFSVVALNYFYSAQNHQVQQQHHKNMVSQMNISNQIQQDQIDQDEQTYDSVILQREKEVILNIKGELQKDSQHMAMQPEEQHYGLSILWNLIQDKNSAIVDKDLIQKALVNIIFLLKQEQSRHLRMHYFLKALSNIMDFESASQSIMVFFIVMNDLDNSHSDLDFQNNQQDSMNDQKQTDGQANSAVTGESLNIKKFLTSIEKQLNFVEVVIQNIAFYNSQVKEKVKQYYEKQQQAKMPSNFEDHCFVGKQIHSDVQEKLLNLLEYLVIRSSQEVTIGTQSIDRLWSIYVKDPNFTSDQVNFMSWVNRPRFNSQYSGELYIFTSEERSHLFNMILCNPGLEESNQLTLGEVKCFHKYFKIINKENGSLNLQRKSLRVPNMQNLVGLKTLWKITVNSKNQKIREDSMDLLIDLYLKYDVYIQKQNKIQILNTFVNECMQLLQSTMNHLDEDLQLQKSKNVIQLLSLFLDKFEGKKEIKPDLKLDYNLQPLNLRVLNKQTMESQEIEITYFNTLGLFRQKVAEAFGIYQNQFFLFINKHVTDPDEDDEKYMKDFQGLNSIQIQISPLFFADIHPKLLLSENQQYFEQLFSMLSKNDKSIVESVWELLNKLPVNQQLQQEIKELSGVKDDQNNWNKILDSASTHKLLYCLKIIQSFNTQDDQYAQKWKYKFIQMGGFNHLLKTMINLQVQSIETNLTLKCIGSLISSLFEFIEMDNKLIQLVLDNKQNIILKSLKFIHMIAEHSKDTEKRRGEGQTYEQLQKKAHNKKQKKQTQKSLMQAWNRNQSQNKAASHQSDDDDKDIAESKILSELYNQFQQVGTVIQNIFKFLNICIFKYDSQAYAVIPQYPQLDSMLHSCLLQCENILIRSEVNRRIQDIIIASLGPDHPDKKQLLQSLVSILLFQILDHTQHYEKRCNSFFESLSEIIEKIELSDIKELEAQINELIFKLTDRIVTREIQEINSQTIDQYLNGLMTVLRCLLQKFPHLKKRVGQKLIEPLVKDFLFQIPQGADQGGKAMNFPKCKNSRSRVVAMNLLAVLTRDCLENLNYVLDFMKDYNQNASWRTKKDSDWNIMPSEDEKSSSGYLGIKNLGCICYMISLFQQLFSIETFRNSILEIEDPNNGNEKAEDNMFYQFQSLFLNLAKSEKQYANPRDFTQSFKDWEGQPINVFEQMDVDEFLQQFTDRLENAIKGTPQEKTIQYHFGGQLSNEMICQDCPHRYEKTEPCLNISLDVKNKRNIYDGLNSYIEGDLLAGDNAYYCEKCDKKIDTIKRQCIKKLPRYMIVTLKRLEFDFERMIRVKVNDQYEFPQEIDFSPYTKEGLDRKEKLEKKKKEADKNDKEAVAQDFENQEELPWKYPKEYYNYKLNGIVVHTGTADSGHYYSFIKEKKDPTGQKWYEFNDETVRDFDPNDIPRECFGGEETYQTANMSYQKFTKFRNAYLLIYERNTLDEVDYDDVDQPSKSESQFDSSNIAKYKDEDQMEIDSEIKNKDQLQDPENQDKKLQKQPKTGVLDTNHPLNLQIEQENKKYWQNRFLSSQEYTDFVYQLTLYWNTSEIIPKISFNFNDDFDILGIQNSEQLKLQIFSEAFNEDILKQHANLDSKQSLDLEQVKDTRLKVFKFLTQFYVTILQRTSQKHLVPQMIRLIKAHINHDIACAFWVLKDFSNFALIKECLLECNSKEMRMFVSGIIYAAMLKVYSREKERINLYWKSVQFPQEITKDTIIELKEPVARTVIGNFVLILVKHMFEVKFYMQNNSQYFQLISRFSSLGQEARDFLLRARIVGRCMDYFFQEQSPHKDIFRNMTDISVEETLEPDIGLPTVSNKKNMSWAQQIQEKKWEQRFMNGKHKYKHLVQIVSNCVRSLSLEQGRTPYQLGNSEISKIELIEHDLFTPGARFLKRFFINANKRKLCIDLAHCYLHYTYFDSDINEVMNIIEVGLMENDFTKINVFLRLFREVLLSQNDSYVSKFDAIMRKFMAIVAQNLDYFKFTEMVFDFVFVIIGTIPKVKQWFYKNPKQWNCMIEWLKENKYPPTQIGAGSVRLLKNKPGVAEKNIHQQQQKSDPQRPLLQNWYRKKRMESLMNSDFVDNPTSEVDIDALDMIDHKFVINTHVEVYNKWTDFAQYATVINVLDEMIQIQYVQTNLQKRNREQPYVQWKRCDSQKLFQYGTYKSLYKTQITEQYSQQLEQQKLEKMKQERQMYKTGQYNASSQSNKQGAGSESDEMEDIEQQNSSHAANNSRVTQDVKNVEPSGSTQNYRTGQQAAHTATNNYVGQNVAMDDESKKASQGGRRPGLVGQPGAVNQPHVVIDNQPQDYEQNYDVSDDGNSDDENL